MNNWHLKYLGKKWVAAPKPPLNYNCSELARYIYKAELNIELPMVTVDAMNIKQCVETMGDYVHNLRPLLWNETPREYDVAFMARTKFYDHCGVGVDTSEGLMILHCQQDIGVVLESVFDLQERYKKISWYR